MEITINIRQSSKFNFIRELLGSFPFVEIVGKNQTSSKQKENRKVTEPEDASIDPNMLFGKWKHLDIDAKKLRRESWQRA